MPHVTVQVSAGGPLVDILVGPSRAHAAALQKAGKPVPERIPVRALIDTGASVTVLDAAIVRKLALTATGMASLQTPSTGREPHVAHQYDVRILLVSPIAKRATGFDNIAVVEADLSTQELQALLGRDILRQCLFVFDGVAGLFSLAF